MKIAILRCTLHEGSGQVAHILELVNGLRNMDHNVIVFSREVEIKEKRMPIKEIGFPGDYIPFLRNIIFPFRHLSDLKEFDIVHTQYHPAILTGNLAKRTLEKPHIFTYHGFAPIAIWRNPRQRMKMIDHRIGTFLALRFGVDRIISVSNYLKRELVNAYKFDEKKIRVIYNGVDTKRFNPKVRGDEIRKKYGLDNAPVVLYLGRLAPYKGVHHLIKAMPLILRLKPEVKFLIAGSGRYDIPDLLDLAEHFGVRKGIRFTGYIPDKLIPKLYACCDVFCYPSLWEGFGLPVAEAGAMGKPVVSFKICAIPEVIKNGLTGLLVRPGHTQLAQAIITLLEDNRTRKRMGIEARNRVSRMFSWGSMVEKTLEVYEEVLG